MKTVFIYALCEPGTRIVRDIGKATNPERRLKQHWYRSRKQKNHLGDWLRSLSSLPTLLILKEVPESEWQEWERRYIRCARSLGLDLVNGTPGGDGASFPGDKNPMFGKHHSQEAKDKIRAGNCGELNPRFGKKFTAASIEKMRTARLGERNPFFGKKHTGSVIEKMRVTNCGELNPRFGVRHTAASKLKIRIIKSFSRLLKLCQPIE